MSTCRECYKFWTREGLCWGKCLRNLSTRHIAFEACSDFTPRCPLPRVGSKDWGWSDKAQHTMKANGDRYAVTEYSWGVDVECNADYLAENVADVDLAKRLCELHARREWMRKNKAARKDGGK